MIPIVDHQRTRTGDGRHRMDLTVQPQRTGGLAARAQLVEHALEPHQRAGARQQRVVFDGFGQKIVSPRLKPLQALGGIVEGADHDDRNMQSFGIGL